METVTGFIFLGSKITADGDCSHEFKRCLILRRKVMTNLDSMLKSRDITLPTKVHLVKAMAFPVDLYGCESWIIKKAECWRIDAFFFFFHLLSSVGGQSLHNTAVVSITHRHESAMDLHVFLIWIPPPTSLSTQSLEIELPYDPAIPLLGIHTEETRTERDTCTHVHRSTVYNSQDMEAT